MTAPGTPIWPIEPRTQAKHEILRRYLQAWFPILAQSYPRVVYLDGFAGPGRYSNGEEGSPLIALQAARTQFARLTSSELVFIFVEEDEARAKHLRDVEIPALKLPAHFRVHTLTGTFEKTLAKLLDSLDAQGQAIAPTFALIDPFGISGLPFSLVSRLLSRPQCEVLITFMTHTIQRFVTELPNHVNTLIGIPDAADQIRAASDRATMARRLYNQSLRKSARYVHAFNMYSTKDTPIYDLVFATNHVLGYVRMKEAMWAVDGSGAFSFSEGVDPTQLTLLSPTPHLDLAKFLLDRFEGRRVDCALLRKFVAEETIYISSHLTAALRGLEQDQRIAVEPLKADGRRRNKGGFAIGTLVNFPSTRRRDE